jgi:ribosomal protein S18 acetylase RimI-like enzyme
MLRDLKPTDSAQLFAFLKEGFPEEEALQGTRPEGVEKVVRRVFRWDTRILLGLLRLFGRPFFRFYVIEVDRRLAATTLLSFSPRAGYVSMVMVDAAHRRQGLARRLLEEARRTTARRGLRYIALDVLEGNAPARTLYASIGYRPLRSRGWFALDAPGSLAAPPPGTTGVRPFRPSDARPLVEIARRQTPREVDEVIPMRAGDLTSSNWTNQILLSESAAWVVDRGHGPEAYIGATSSPVTEAAHLTSPIVGDSVDADTARTLVLTACAWLAPRRPPRILAIVPDDNERGRAALGAVGFRRALPLLTLYRESA